MKLVTLPLFLTFFAASVAYGYSDEAVNFSKEQLRLSQARFQAGVATQDEVLAAEVFVVEMNFYAKKIEKSEFCEKVLPIQKKLADYLSKQAAMGMTTTRDLITAKKEFFRLQEFCQ